MTDDDLGRLLDAVPAVDLPPVDLASIYLKAATRQATITHRWRTVTVFAALAASVIAFVSLPVRISWGDPPVAVAPAESKIMVTEERLARMEARIAEQTARMEKLASSHGELRDLLTSVSADVVKRDAAADDDTLAWVSVTDRLKTVDEKLAEVRKDTAALYTLVSAPRGSDGGSR